MKEIPINSIVCGDCADVMSEWPDECIDLTVTSPPYDNLRTYNGYEFNFEAIAQQLYRITKRGGVVVWVVADQTVNGSETGTSFKQALYYKEIGFNLHDTMIYKKSAVGACGSIWSYNQDFEYMFVLTKNTISKFNAIRDLKPRAFGGYGTYTKKSKSSNKGYTSETYKKLAPESSKRTNTWEYSVSFQQQLGEHKHPAIFPEQLAHDHIISWSNEHDIVLDPMCGSGTTAIAAIKTNRRFIGIDVSQEYCNLARNRVNTLLEQTTLDFGDNINYEMIKELS